ncbi:MAG: lytic transglycosylase domain-containing protein, partial [Bacteroidales bacterium]|nr:lytic transglycosylase domain-containing protein [Bacteroidales bacterium]
MLKEKFKWLFWPLMGILLFTTAANIPYTLNDENYYSAISELNTVVSVAIPNTLSFCKEELPLEKQYVREAIEHELIVNTYWHSSSIFLIKRAKRWFPVIQPILKKNGVPDDFKYLAVAESGLKNAVSPAGAR